MIYKTLDQMYLLKLHESMKVAISGYDKVEILRVPNGWIYTFYDNLENNMA